MPVSIPFTFVGGVGNKAKASEVNANFQALAAKFTEASGGISDTDIYSNADINANKLSSTPGKRLIAAKFEIGAVDSAALKADAASGSPAAAVNTSNHIKDGIVLRKKLKARYDEQVWGSASLAAGVTREVTTTFNPTTESLIDACLVVTSTLDDPLVRQLQVLFWYTKTSPISYTAHLWVKNPTAGTLTFQPFPSAMFTFLQD